MHLEFLNDLGGTFISSKTFIAVHSVGFRMRRSENTVKNISDFQNARFSKSDATKDFHEFIPHWPEPSTKGSVAFLSTIAKSRFEMKLHLLHL